VDDSAEPDLFASSGQVAVEGYAGIDGHVLHSPLQMHVCNWLYLAQLTHAHARSLPVDEPLRADFYLPAGRIYIDCWEADVPAGELSGRLRKRDIYAQLGLRHIEINARDENRLDDVLGRRLLEFGLRFKRLAFRRCRRSRRSPLPASRRVLSGRPRRASTGRC
jgi:hypothetical protein